MSNPSARIRVTRPMLAEGHAQPAGAVVALPLEAALEAVEAGRCEFVNPDDRGRCVDARRKSIAGMLRRVPTLAVEPGPWQRVI